MDSAKLSIPIDCKKPYILLKKKKIQIDQKKIIKV